MKEGVSDQFFEALRRPALILDRDGLITAANPAFSSEFQMAGGDVAGRHLTDIIVPDGDWMAADSDGLSMAFRTAASFEVWYAGRLQINRYHDEEGGGYFVFIDVNSQLEAKELLGALSYLVEIFPHPILVWDKSAKLLKFNAPAAEFYRGIGDIFRLGQDRQLLLRTAFEKGVLGPVKLQTKHPFEEVLNLQYQVNGAGPITNEVERKDGSWHRATAYFSPDGWGASFYENITELRQVQSELDSRTREYERILANVPDYIVVADHNYDITYANAAFGEIMGKPPEELLNLPCLPEDTHTNSRGSLEKLFEEVSPEDPYLTFDELKTDASTGQNRWIRWRTNVLFDGTRRTGMIKVGRDMTVEYEQEQVMRQKSTELKKKNESLEQFAAVVSHDLKAPLRHVAIFADMLVEEIEGGNFEQVPAYAKHVQDSAIRMDRVIRRLLEYSKLAYKAISAEQVNLSNIIIEAVQNLESQIEDSRAEILASDLPDFYGDPDLLLQLFQNLIANAVKYCRPGMRPRVNIYCNREAESIRIFVEDNGIGIDPKYAESIFTAFRRLHKDESVYDGFGVGLALCKHIVESHHGTISLDTSYRSGARFVMQFPTLIGG